MKNQIKSFLLDLIAKGYNIRWVQATHTYKNGKEYLSFFNTQSNLKVGLLEITEPIQDNIGDLIREVKYPLLNDEVLQSHLKGLKKAAPETYKGYHTFYEKIIIDNITLEEYEIYLPELYDKIQEVYKIFKKEFVHKNNRHLNEIRLFKEWLQGLPSVLTIPFMYVDILDEAKKYGKEFKTVQEEDDFLEAYWENCAKSFFDLKESL